MAITVAIIDDMTNATDDDLSAFQTDTLLQEGVMKLPQYLTPLNVTATGTPDKNSNVAPGIAYVPNSTSSPVQFYRVLVDATETQLHSDPAANPRIDSVVLFVDLSVAVDANASNVATIEIVEGAEGGVPTTPTDGDIDGDLGASTWIRLADIAIANPFVSITGGDITDQRADAYVDGSKVVAAQASPAYGYNDASGVVRIRSEMDSNGNVLEYDGIGVIQRVIVPASGDIETGVASGAGKIVEIMTGTFSPSDEMVIAEGTQIIGAGVRASIIDCGNFGSAKSVFKTADGADFWRVEGFGIQLDTNGDHAVEIITTSSVVADFVMRDIYITEMASGDFGISTDGNNFIRRGHVENIYIEGDGTGGTAFFIDAGRLMNIIGCRVSAAGGVGFDINDCDDSFFSSCYAAVTTGTGYSFTNTDNIVLNITTKAVGGTAFEADNTNDFFTGNITVVSGGYGHTIANASFNKVP